jgi:hypothetical protein
MEYNNLLNVLHDILYFIPDAIVNTLIFKYAVYSNKYEYKYRIPYTNSLYGVCFNKQLNIICCEFATEFVFIDYLTRKRHDNSLIDVALFNSHMIGGNHGTTYSMMYFNNTELIMRNHDDIMIKYVLINRIYQATLMHTDENIVPHNYIRVCDNYIYTISRNKVQYWFSTYNLNFIKIKESRIYFCHNTKCIMMSAFNGIIYVYTPLYCYAHNINDFDRYHTIEHSLTHSTIRLYKDKIYCCRDKQILIYDFITMEQIHCINIKKTDDVYELFISDGALILRNSTHIMFYDIK